MPKRILAGTFLMLFLTLIGGLFYNALKLNRLSLGRVLPDIVFRTTTGFNERLQVDSTRMTLVVYFHSDCEPCLTQLNLFNEAADVFNDVRILLLTDEKDFFATPKMHKWPNLMTARKFIWGIDETEQIVERFGARVTPTFYIFDKVGMLKTRIVGEASLEKLLKELKKLR